MNRMVKKLLSLNQLEFGKEQLELERFDMTALIKGVAGAAGILAQQKEATIIFLQKEPVYVWGDEYRLEEVVTNYVSNAINHVAGKKIIEITIEQTENSCRVNVFNTGAPIPEEDLDKIWDKFYKVDKAHTRAYGGNGIGLSIVKAVMDIHRGRCGVENREDGVLFWFELVDPES
jgi:signal transduction histidine kinase